MFGHDLGWRAGFLVIGIVSMLLAWTTLTWAPESHKWLKYQQELDSGTLPEALKRTSLPYADLFRGGLAGGTLAFMVIMTANFMISYSIGTFGPTFLLNVAKVPLGDVAEILFFGFFVTIASYLGFSALSDVIRRKWAFFVSNLVGAVGFSAYLYLMLSNNTYIGTNFWTSPMFWAMSIVQGSFGGAAIVGVWMSEFYPTRVRSTGSNTAYYTGRGLGAGVYPLVALGLAGGSVAYALGLGIVGAVVALSVSIVAPDRTGREIRAIE
jgi:SHS family lactate transporter-like MFS transporter